MNRSTESFILGAFAEYYNDLLQHMSDKLTHQLLAESTVPDEDTVIYTILHTGLRIIGGKWRGRGAATLRARDIVNIDDDSVHFWVPRGPNKITDLVVNDPILAYSFSSLTAIKSDDDRLFRTTYANVLERFYTYEREINGTETFIPKDIRRFIATYTALNAMGRDWSDEYKFEPTNLLPHRRHRADVISGHEDQ